MERFKSHGIGPVFLSYRQADTRHVVRSLWEWLESRLGSGQVFRDVAAIDPGHDFSISIMAALRKCNILIAVIGDEWLSIVDSEGRRRIDDANDFVRIEIEEALKRGIPILPVLVDGAKMPQAADLPPSLFSLARLQALELSDGRFSEDVERLFKALEKLDENAGRKIPKYEVAGYLRGEALRHSHKARYEAALALYDATLYFDPRDSSSLGYRAQIHIELGNFMKALEDLDEVVRLKGPNKYTLSERAEVYLQLGRNDDALSDASWSVQLAPDDDIGFHCRAKVLAMMGRYEDAIHDVESATNNGHPRDRDYYGRLKEKYRKAKREAEGNT